MGKGTQTEQASRMNARMVHIIMLKSLPVCPSVSRSIMATKPVH
jgi:hypothetical protein